MSHRALDFHRGVDDRNCTPEIEFRRVVPVCLDKIHLIECLQPDEVPQNPRLRMKKLICEKVRLMLHMRVLALVARYAQLASWTMIIRKAPRALCDMRMAMYCSDVAPHTATAAPRG